LLEDPAQPDDDCVHQVGGGHDDHVLGSRLESDMVVPLDHQESAVRAQHVAVALDALQGVEQAGAAHDAEPEGMEHAGSNPAADVKPEQRIGRHGRRQFPELPHPRRGVTRVRRREQRRVEAGQNFVPWTT